MTKNGALLKVIFVSALCAIVRVRCFSGHSWLTEQARSAADGLKSTLTNHISGVSSLTNAPVNRLPSSSTHTNIGNTRGRGRRVRRNNEAIFSRYLPPGNSQSRNEKRSDLAEQSNHCVPAVLCRKASSILTDQRNQLSSCILSDGSHGVVCSDDSLGNETTNGARSSAPLPDILNIPDISLINLNSSPRNSFPINVAQSVIERATSAAHQLISQIRASTNNRPTLPQLQSQLKPTDLQAFNHLPTIAAQNQGFQALEQILSMTNLQNFDNNTWTQIQQTFNNINAEFSGSPLRSSRPETAQSTHGNLNVGVRFELPNCSPAPKPFCTANFYQNIDGTCNNLINPNLGAALKGFKRLLPSTYDDFIFTPRAKSVFGGSLPGARTISEKVFTGRSKELFGISLSVMQFGQFIDHDLSHQILPTNSSGSTIQCCEDGGRVFPSQPRHPQCFPIAVDSRDSFYGRYGQRCMSLVRSLPAASPDCFPRPAVPLNELTAYLDASHIYGSQPEEAKRIRLGRAGLLITSRGNLLPTSQGSDRTQPMCRRDLCFIAGETRVNEQSGLTVTHTIFHREHNRVAQRLKELKGSLDDETLYMMSRRIVTAEWQHIVYNEWLPLILGHEYSRQHGLLPFRYGSSLHYSSTIDPSISTEFATAAFRFGHSLIRTDYDLIDAHGNVINSVNLTSTFFDPTVVFTSLVEHARTFVARRGQEFDSFLAPAIQEKLFITNNLFGLDLMSLNIQRGRDHGIPTYTSMLEACTSLRIQYWGDLSKVMTSKSIDRLRAVYADPKDVDLVVGGFLETPAQQAIVGPTFRCIIAQQFFDLRYGDRFFYDNGEMKHSFSDAQLGEIRKSSWARIMCDNLRSGTEVFDKVQPLAFLEEHPVYNRIASCDSLAIPRVDLQVF